MKVRADSLSHTADIFGATRSAAAVVHSCFFSEKKMENFFYRGINDEPPSSRDTD